MIEITLPDGSRMECSKGTTVLEIAKEIGSRLAKDAIAGRIDGELVDLTRPVNDDCSIQIVTFDDDDGKHVYWHTAAHVMADAVVDLFPKSKPTIGPPIEDGFYYDFDTDVTFSDDDLQKIEDKMQEIIDADLPMQRREISIEQARELFEDNPYKLELIDDIAEEEDTVSVYAHDGFVDLCQGPHLPSTGRLTAIKLTSVAGAYWHGDENNPMLQRIYGIAYPKQKMLKEHIERMEEAKRRDHRRLGRELDLFSFHEEAGAGLPYYHPKGAMLRQIVVDFSTEKHLERGYDLLRTPHLVKSDIWETSGHRQQDYPMYFTEIEGTEYGIKPMNCPGHILIYNSHTRSYRDLPIRYFELGTVYRHELSGVLHGLMRVRGFTQDDAHIFCREDQLLDELTGVIEFAGYMLSTFGFDEYEVYLSTRPEKSVGTDAQWELATNALIQALDANDLDYEEDEGGGAFYGPKIDIKVKDAIGRLWQCPTIQCDFTQPERFDITYIGEDGDEHRPVMIHRVVLAGIERFLGVLIENYAGAFPLWLSPVQVMVLPIADRNNEYAQQVADRMSEEGFRVEVDTQSGTLGNKVRHAEEQKVPYMFVVGDNEQKAGSVALRSRKDGDEGPQLLDEVIDRLKREDVPGGP